MAMWDNMEWQSPEQMRSLAEVSRLNALISDEEVKINNMYCQIGKLYAKVHRDDSEEEFAGLVAAAQESESKIEEYRVRILDVKGLVRCPKCGMELPKAAAFCMACGTSIPKVETPALEETETPAETVCANCGAELAGDALFCAQCGTSVQAAADPAPVEDDTCEKPVEESAAEEETPTRFACGNCGAVLDYGALFCAQCGVSMKDAAVPYVEDDAPWDKSPEALSLDSFDEEIPVETPEEPDCVNDEELGVMTAPADLDEEDTSEEPVAAPAVEAVAEELPVEAPVEEAFEEEPPVKVSVKLACANCGADLVDDALFCTECGTPVKAAAAPEPEENDSGDAPLEAPALYIVKEEPPVEAPEKPVSFTGGGFGVLMAPADLDEDDMWGAPVEAPVVEAFPEEVPAEVPKEPAGASPLLISIPDLDEEDTWGVAAEAPAVEVFEEELSVKVPAKLACTNCGADLVDDALFCTECGTPVKAAATPEPEENDSWDEAPALYIVEEKTPVAAPEKPVSSTGGGFGVLMAPTDLDDDDGWGVPVEPFKAEPSVKVPAKLACANCGAALEENMMFCTECGTPAAKAAIPGSMEHETCRGCGAMVEKGMKFCTECGMPMEVQAVTASGKRFCLTCGTVLEDGVLFCTECGTRV